MINFSSQGAFFYPISYSGYLEDSFFFLLMTIMILKHTAKIIGMGGEKKAFLLPYHLLRSSFPTFEEKRD